MAKVSVPVIGKTTGQAGGMVFQSWKGTQIMRSRPGSYAASQSSAAVAQRSKMKAITEIMKFIQIPVRQAFKEAAKSITEFNAFVKANINIIDAITMWFAVGEQDSAQFSSGSLRMPTQVNCSVVANQLNLLSKKSDVITPEDNANDLLNFIVVNNTQRNIKHMPTMAKRSDTGSMSFNIPMEFNDEVYVYAYYLSPDGKKASSTFPVGLFTVTA